MAGIASEKDARMSEGIVYRKGVGNALTNLITTPPLYLYNVHLKRSKDLLGTFDQMFDGDCVIVLQNIIVRIYAYLMKLNYSLASLRALVSSIQCRTGPIGPPLAG
jgi:hypothetical protein